eukprot:216325-Pyramimonas_sp.AAC.1
MSAARPKVAGGPGRRAAASLSAQLPPQEPFDDDATTDRASTTQSQRSPGRSSSDLSASAP